MQSDFFFFLWVGMPMWPNLTAVGQLQMTIMMDIESSENVNTL